MSDAPNFMLDLFDGLTRRTATTATIGPELTVGIERAGTATLDLSGFDITSRKAVLNIKGRKYLLTSGTARALAGALMEAACIIDREESQ